MPPTRADWANAYARQSASDFGIFEVELERARDCHRLHYLQMACEKIAKAYRFRDTATSAEDLTSGHVAFSRFIPALLVSRTSSEQYRGHAESLARFGSFARLLARDIERLAPAVDPGASPGNAEYPWEEHGAVIAPCDYPYPNLQRLRTPEGQRFLKLAKDAIARFDEIRIR